MTKVEWREQLRQSEYAWATDPQWDGICLILDWVQGAHHLTGKITACGYGNGVEYNATVELSTFDFGRLTNLVFLAHDRCIRVEIQPNSSSRLKILCHKRKGRRGMFAERHPTIERALRQWRLTNKSEEVISNDR